MSEASQRKSHSFVETITNTAIGYVINVTVQPFVFAAFGIHINAASDLLIGAIFTGISIVRGYVLRRLFNFIHVRWSRIETAYKILWCKAALFPKTLAPTNHAPQASALPRMVTNRSQAKAQGRKKKRA